MKAYLFFVPLLAYGLVACGGSHDADEAVAPSTTTTASAAETTSKAAASPPLPEDAPEIGTDIAELIKPAAEADEPEKGTDSAAAAVTTIMWKDLIPADFRPDAIMAKYQQEIDNTPEGALEERALFDKIMAEFNNAPANETLNGKQIRIPGFVSPLDEHEGMVREFLLVPYFGSCIHSPPPPVNQTILVKPQQGKSISIDQIYSPVWVTGQMTVAFSNTALAPAGYLIEQAALEIYQETPEDQ